ncbi:N-6 DNA methylase [Metabacillus litoralis]|uniref:N-6 DNA methylase n=1 Tax=Metabacillus litoralis TaxID=152268 RepID=UPI00203E8038|nr:N-6 DNA methylase [Metabacillus litoralis]MCM3654107.1 N-6 DNA methylase [Metabacillus litoralis]
MQKNNLCENIERDIWDFYEIYKSSIDNVKIKHLLSLITLKFLSENPNHLFEVPDDSRWDFVTSTGVNFGLKLNQAFRQLEQVNPKLEGVFTLNDYSEFKEPINLFKVADSVLNRYTFADSDYKEMNAYLDHLWNILIGKERDKDTIGGIISPPSITKLLPQLLNIFHGKIYDGSSGINSFLINAHKQAVQNGGQVQLFGQEVNAEAWSLGIMNLLLRGLYPEKADVKVGHTIREPKLTFNGDLMRFDGIITEPPFGVAGWGFEVAKNDVYGRFRYGIPGRALGDMAFILHSIASLEKKGKAINVISNGVLLRGGSEEKIRGELINNDLIEAVISLPSRLHINTIIPVSLLIINKNKPDHLINKVLFINAEECYEKINRTQNELGENDIEKIVDTYLNSKEVENFSRLVSADEIAANEWIIYPSRYFDRGKVTTKLGKFEISRKNYELSDVKMCDLQSLSYDISRGLSVTKEISNNESPSHYLINLANVQEGKINHEDLTEIRLDSKKSKEYELQPGDVLISSRGTSSKIVVISDKDLVGKKLAYSNNFIRIRVNKEKMDPYFLKTFLESPPGKYLLEFNQTGTIGTVLSHKDIKSLLIPLPSIEKQKEVADLIFYSEQKYDETIRMAQRERTSIYHKSYKLMGISQAYEIIDEN